jgi:glycosyltransferase involved in cell wall biosynthesis
MKQQWNFAIAREFDRVLADFQPDILHTHSLLDVSTLVWWAARRRKIPIVHTVCEYDLMCGNSAMFRRGAPCERWHAHCQAITITKRLNTRLVDAVTFVGSEIKKTHLQHGCFTHLAPDRQRVIFYSCSVPGGDRAARSAIDRSGKPMTFGYLGRINVEKGVGTMIDAFRRIGPSEGWRCLIAGAAMDDSLERFRAQAEGLPIEFVGFVDPAKFFNEIDVLIVPSFWAEPSPRTIYEAYSMGLPCIGARAGGIPELIGENNSAWLFDAGDDSDLAKRLASVLKGGRENLPDAGAYEWVVRESTSRRVAENFLALYRDVLATRPAHVATGVAKRDSTARAAAPH